MRAHWWTYPLALAALLAASCGTQDTCGGACHFWQSCEAGECLPLAGYCDADDDCDSYLPTCDLTTHTCISHRCDPACGEWETCVDEQCVTNEGRCSKHLDCPVLCDFATHTCTENYCDPPCEDWQVCEQTSCVPKEGRCTSDADCGGDTPVCSDVTRACSPAPGGYTEVPTDPIAALVVTREALRGPMETLARLHTVTGTPTRVVTVEEICAGAPCDDADPTKDTAKAIKDYLLSEPGLKTVILGGDLEVVPSRTVHDAYSNDVYAVSFEEDFETDLYYADLSEWDTNGDGRYAVDGEDAPDHLADLAIGRIPVSTVAEADAYLAKVVAHLTAFDTTRTRSVLALSNVATTFETMFGSQAIDGALYLELDGRTLSLLPADAQVRKIYAKVRVDGSEPLTVDVERAALEQGGLLVVHAGHGGEDLLTVEIDGSKAFTGDMAAGLVTAAPPFFLSSACSAGNFAASDSAGERYVLAPAGGAIGYLGNTATGLGLAGGSQLIDEILRAAYDGSAVNPPIGEVVRRARNALPAVDNIALVQGIDVPVVDVDSWEWTQKSATWLGDPLVPFWNEATLWAAPSLTMDWRTVADAAQLTFQTYPPMTGELLIEADDRLYRVELLQQSQVVVELPVAPRRITAAVQPASSLAAWVDETR